MKCVKMCTRRSSGKWEDRNALSRNCIYIHICTYYYYKRTLHMQAMVPELLSCRRNECLRITWIQRAIPSVFMYLATKCAHKKGITKIAVCFPQTYHRRNCCKIVAYPAELCQINVQLFRFWGNPFDKWTIIFEKCRWNGTLKRIAASISNAFTQLIIPLNATYKLRYVAHSCCGVSFTFGH